MFSNFFHRAVKYIIMELMDNLSGVLKTYDKQLEVSLMILMQFSPGPVMEKSTLWKVKI